MNIRGVLMHKLFSLYRGYSFEHFNEARKGIFLLYGGISSTVIESQVFSHAKFMKSIGVDMEIWIFTSNAKSFLNAEACRARLNRDYGIEFRVFTCIKPNIPFSPWINGILLGMKIHHSRLYPSFIHARTEYAAVVASFIKSVLPVKVICDSRGDSLSELIETETRFTPIARLLFVLKMGIVKRRLELAFMRADAAIFVSEELRRLYVGKISNQRTFVIPCLADDTLFYFSNDLRIEARKQLGYRSDDIVIVYVGSTAPWQCVAETVTLIEKALICSSRVKALVITPEVSTFRSLFSENLVDRVLVISVSYGDINYYLNASDYGFMLRKESAVNYVASPVKFGEYCLSGLLIVTTTAVEQVNNYGNIIGNVISPERFITEISDFGSRNCERRVIASRAKDILSRGAIKNLSEIYEINSIQTK
jgi:hypothetical protein